MPHDNFHFNHFFQFIQSRLPDGSGMGRGVMWVVAFVFQGREAFYMKVLPKTENCNNMEKTVNRV